MIFIPLSSHWDCLECERSIKGLKWNQITEILHRRVRVSYGVPECSRSVGVRECWNAILSIWTFLDEISIFQSVLSHRWSPAYFIYSEHFWLYFATLRVWKLLLQIHSWLFLPCVKNSPNDRLSARRWYISYCVYHVFGIFLFSILSLPSSRGE